MQETLCVHLLHLSTSSLKYLCNM